MQGGRVFIGKILVVAQVALSLLLLVVAGLFIRSFRNLSDAQLGFNTSHVLQFHLEPLTYGYQRPEIPRLYEEMLLRLAAIPGVRGATLTDHTLLSGSDSNDDFSIEGQKDSAGARPEARNDAVGPNFFSTAGIPILVGREIGPQDSGNGQRVGVINQAMVQKYFANSNPLGKRIIVHTTSGDIGFVIVGVSANWKHGSVRERSEPRFCIPFFNPIYDVTNATIVVSASGDLSATIAAIRSTLKGTASNLPPPTIQTMNQRIADSLTTDRMMTQLSGAFGTLAVILVCIGLYGIMAYAVSGRTNEIGIRIALGAQRGNILWPILRESLLLVFIGAAIGLPAVLGAGKWISSLLFSVKPADPITLVLAVALMFVVGILACYIPARRAMRVDPIVALRYE
jgi:predicted permease